MKPATTPRQRLLERLNQDPACHPEDPGLRLQSIRHHLELLLSCRLDSCRCAPELGVSDFNAAHLAGADLRDQIANAISVCIHRYDPVCDECRFTLSAPRFPGSWRFISKGRSNRPTSRNSPVLPCCWTACSASESDLMRLDHYFQDELHRLRHQGGELAAAFPGLCRYLGHAGADRMWSDCWRAPHF